MRAGRFRQTWRERRPYPSYLFGFALGPFTRTAQQHRPTRLETYAVALDAAARERMFADTGPMLDFFASKAGLPLPHDHYRQVVVDGDEAQEATSFSLLGRTHLDPLLDTPQEDWVIAHELAHQFWGNLVTCADWPHFWLNEGLTVFMVAAWKERRWGRPAYERELELARKRHAVAVAAGFDVPLTFSGRYPSLRRAPGDRLQQGGAVRGDPARSHGRAGVLVGAAKVHPAVCRAVRHQRRLPAGIRVRELARSRAAVRRLGEFAGRGRPLKVLARQGAAQGASPFILSSATPRSPHSLWPVRS